MTIAMLSLAGFPATAGFFGKVYLIGAAVDNGYSWLGVVIVLGSAISLAYYLRVVAAVWMRAPETRRRRGCRRGRRARRSRAGRRRPTRTRRRVAGARSRARPIGGWCSRRSSASRSLCAAATIFFGVYPEPLLDLAHDAGAALTELF